MKSTDQVDVLFNLTHLSIHFSALPFPLPLLSSLLQLDLVSLIVDFSTIHCSRLRECYLSSLEKLTPACINVSTLTVAFKPLPLDAARFVDSDRLIKFVSHFKGLQSLTCDIATVGPFSQGAIDSLETLRLVGNARGSIYPGFKGRDSKNKVLIAERNLKLTLASLKNLKRLEIDLVWGWDVYFVPWVGFEKLPVFCRKRGVELVWVGKWEQPECETKFVLLIADRTYRSFPSSVVTKQEFLGLSDTSRILSRPRLLWRRNSELVGDNLTEDGQYNFNYGVQNQGF